MIDFSLYSSHSTSILFASSKRTILLVCVILDTCMWIYVGWLSKLLRRKLGLQYCMPSVAWYKLYLLVGSTAYQYANQGKLGGMPRCRTWTVSYGMVQALYQTVYWLFWNSVCTSVVTLGTLVWISVVLVWALIAIH